MDRPPEPVKGDDGQPRDTYAVRDMLLYGVRDARLEGDVVGDIVELFTRREDAQQFLAECLADEPDWADVLSVEPVEFEFSAN